MSVQTSAAASITVSSNPKSSLEVVSAPAVGGGDGDGDDDAEVDVYDEIEIEDMTLDSKLQIYHYPCPCGDRFEILISDLRDGRDIAVCPSCSLMIRVVFEVEDLPELTESGP